MLASALVLLLVGTPVVPSRKPRAAKVQAAKRDLAAIAASLKAARSEDPQVRSAAFLSLSKAGLEKRVPDAEPEEAAPRCARLPSDGGCKSEVFVCSKTEVVDTETHYASADRTVGFGMSQEAAIADLPSHLFSRSRTSGSEGTDTQCVVVFLDGCAGRAGMVCTTATSTNGVANDQPAKTEVFDLRFK